MTAVLPVEVADAVQPGHDLEYDPVASLSAAEQWTCRRCGRVAITYDTGIYGTTAYGSATKQACDDNPDAGGTLE